MHASCSFDSMMIFKGRLGLEKLLTKCYCIGLTYHFHYSFTCLLSLLCSSSHCPKLSNVSVKIPSIRSSHWKISLYNYIINTSLIIRVIKLWFLLNLLKITSNCLRDDRSIFELWIHPLLHSGRSGSSEREHPIKDEKNRTFSR